MDLSRAEQATILIDEVPYQAKLVKVSDIGEYVFEIVGGKTLEQNTSAKRARLFFDCDQKKYSCGGHVLCTAPPKVVFVPATRVTADRRSAVRYDLPSLPGRAKELDIVFHFIPVSILNLSKGGAGLETKHTSPLSPNKVYVLEVKFGRLNTLNFVVPVKDDEFYSSGFLVKNMRKKGQSYVYGVQFHNTSPRCRKLLEKLIEELAR